MNTSQPAPDSGRTPTWAALLLVAAMAAAAQNEAWAGALGTAATVYSVPHRPRPEELAMTHTQPSAAHLTLLRALEENGETATPTQVERWQQHGWLPKAAEWFEPGCSRGRRLERYTSFMDDLLATPPRPRSSPTQRSGPPHPGQGA